MEEYWLTFSSNLPCSILHPLYLKGIIYHCLLPVIATRQRDDFIQIKPLSHYGFGVMCLAEGQEVTLFICSYIMETLGCIRPSLNDNRTRVPTVHFWQMAVIKVSQWGIKDAVASRWLAGPHLKNSLHAYTAETYRLTQNFYFYPQGRACPWGSGAADVFVFFPLVHDKTHS